MSADLESVDEALNRAAKVIDGASEVALACHVTPDGDALGSVLALHHVLRGRGPDEHRLVPGAVPGRAALPRPARSRAADPARRVPVPDPS